jgi:hypothetical protein
MENSKYKIEIELESDLDEYKVKQFFEDHFDTGFLKINKINISKEEK